MPQSESLCNRKTCIARKQKYFPCWLQRTSWKIHLLLLQNRNWRPLFTHSVTSHLLLLSLSFYTCISFNRELCDDHYNHIKYSSLRSRHDGIRFMVHATIHATGFCVIFVFIILFYRFDLMNLISPFNDGFFAGNDLLLWSMLLFWFNEQFVIERNVWALYIQYVFLCLTQSWVKETSQFFNFILEVCFKCFCAGSMVIFSQKEWQLMIIVDYIFV